jgi:replicative superfamily II helicase
LPIRRYLEESGVPLDTEQRGVLEEINDSKNALHIVSASAGKTVLAHCIIKCFVEEFYGSDPRCLVLYTVPTRTLRDEVVADIIKFKAGVV